VIFVTFVQNLNICEFFHYRIRLGKPGKAFKPPGRKMLRKEIRPGERKEHTGRLAVAASYLPGISGAQVRRQRSGRRYRGVAGKEPGRQTGTDEDNRERRRRRER
jgi:hypothetical protein